MPSQAVLILVLLSALPLQAQDICCQVKTVAGANAGALAGTYNFLKNADTKDPNCSDGCIYTKVGSPGEEYCFTPVPEAQGASITEEQCAAPTVQENQQKIEENVDKIKKGEDATTTIAEINAKLNEGLTTSSGRLREKRQAGTTVPVAKPTNCGEFETTFEALLDLAIAVDDSNILQIQVYVNALKPIDVGTICNPTEKAALAGKTNAKATTATGKTKDYIGKKNSDNENLKE